MTTQNRYYSNIATATTITTPGGLSTSTPTLQLASTAGFPTSFPFLLRLEPNTLNEEIVEVTSGSGTSLSPYAITRGFDQTTAKTHAPGVPVQHGFAQIDFAEPQQHLNLNTSTSAAHGLPSSAWNNMSVQLITSTTLASNAASVSFSSIPQTFNHLYFRCMVQSNGTNSLDFDYIGIQWNGISTSTYNSVESYVSSPVSATTSVNGQTSATAAYVATPWNTHAGTSAAGFFTVEFPFYYNTTFRKSFFTTGVGTDGGSAGNIYYFGGSNSTNTAAITSVTFVAAPSGSTATLFEAGSSFFMYGSS